MTRYYGCYASRTRGMGRRRDLGAKSPRCTRPSPRTVTRFLKRRPPALTAYPSPGIARGPRRVEKVPERP